MMRHFILAAAISVASVLAAPSAPPLTGTKSIVPTPVCSSAIYSYLLPLSNIPIAESWCSSKYPITPVTSTATAPAVTVSTTVATTTTTVTVSTFDYTTVITNPTTAFTATATVIVPVTETETVTAQAFSKRATSSINYSTRPPILLNFLYRSLTAQATGFASTLCSCIEGPAATTSVTVTPTTTVNLFATTTVTVTKIIATVSVAATTTINAIATTTVSSTTTTTVIVAPSSTAQPVCTALNVLVDGTFNYVQKFVGTGLTSGDYNPGNSQPDIAPPITTALTTGATADCDAIQDCANMAANQPGASYFTVVVYQLLSTGQWMCQQFFDPTYNPNPATDVATPNADVRVVYEYTLN